MLPQEGTLDTSILHDKCKKCGECCRHIHLIDGDKVVERLDIACPMLKNNLCSIYNNRPSICMSGERMKELSICPDNCGYKEE